MVRNIEKFNQSLKTHERWQLDYFNMLKRKLVERAEEWKRRGDQEKYERLMDEISRMKFQFDKSDCTINYGHCKKFNKEISFIPNICQLDTQECFKHRKSISQ
jgi:predicted house-cleaning noncanonical NTP pyrophosphatase (MazG superfamily)